VQQTMLHCAKKIAIKKKTKEKKMRTHITLTYKRWWRLFNRRLLRATTREWQTGSIGNITHLREGSRHVQYRLYKRPSYTFRSVFFFPFDGWEINELLLSAYSPSLRIQLICESKCWGTHVDTSQDPPFSLPYQKLYEAVSLHIPSDWNRCPVLKANADRPSQNDIHTHTHTEERESQTRD
jgi:hypothetical protein